MHVVNKVEVIITSVSKMATSIVVEDGNPKTILVETITIIVVKRTMAILTVSPFLLRNQR